jgi:predicted DNA-binding protein (MmcQ/YjbR family)
MATEDIRPDWLAQLRQIALPLPEATEKETWGHPTFRVRDKIFVGMGVGGDSVDFHPDLRPALTTMSMKAAPGEQESLLAIGHPFFRPRYVGNRGWIGIVVDDDTDWAEVEELVLDSYRATAPKRLVKLLDG